MSKFFYKVEGLQDWDQFQSIIKRHFKDNSIGIYRRPGSGMSEIYISSNNPINSPFEGYQLIESQNPIKLILLDGDWHLFGDNNLFNEE